MKMALHYTLNNIRFFSIWSPLLSTAKVISPREETRDSQVATIGNGHPMNCAQDPLRHHCAWEEQEWKTRKREREDNTLCEDKIRKKKQDGTNKRCLRSI